MEEAWSDKYLKEHARFIRPHTVIHDCSYKPKSPYQLDLETKDRKPGIVPKVGDKVRIKSLAWYEKWKDKNGCVCDALIFYPSMKKYCGRIMTVSRVTDSGNFEFKEDPAGFIYGLSSFEDVYPQRGQTGLFSGIESPKATINLGGLPPCSVREEDLLFSIKEQERLRKQLREKRGVKPKLKQIKTTRLNKITRL